MPGVMGSYATFDTIFNAGTFVDESVLSVRSLSVSESGKVGQRVGHSPNLFRQLFARVAAHSVQLM